MKLINAAEQFATESGRLRTPGSVTSFMKVLSHLEGAVGRNCDLLDVTPANLTAWCLSNRAAPATVKKRRGHARSFFGWCAYRGWIPTDPASGLTYSVVPGRGGVRTHTWLSKEQAVHVIRTLGSTEAGQRDRLIIMLGALCGLRAQEICNLRWRHFADDYVRLSVYGKGNKPAVIGVPPELRPLLTEWRALTPTSCDTVLPTVTWGKGHGMAGDRVREFNWLKPLAYHGVLYAVKQAGRHAGVSNLCPHDLRRTFAGILEESGVAVTDIQRAMRHNDVGTTSRYLESNPNRTVEATAGLTLGL